MINEIVGRRVEKGGQIFIKTNRGAAGHAIYGPYEARDPGNYFVEYLIEHDQDEVGAPDKVCAIVEVSCEFGKTVLAKSPVKVSDLQKGGVVKLIFALTEWKQGLEYRVFVNGSTELLIADRPVITITTLDRVFPENSNSRFFNDNIQIFKNLFDSGLNISFLGSDAVFTASGVSFYAKHHDDFNFIEEIFLKNTYNIYAPRPSCFIDVGMNIGFTSLRMALRDDVKEVHAFEPFTSTFERAAANVALNPGAAAKIRMESIGLSDRDQSLLVKLDSADTGSYSVVGSPSGTPTQIEIKDAATILRPIINSAKSRGLLVIMKVDCEGSEFAIFKSLAAKGLLADISALMVEWHVAWGSHRELTAPLIKIGFSVVDLAPRSGNGFFYAIKTAL